MNKLLPCPFCGGRASVMFDFKKVKDITENITIERKSVYWVKCNRCHVSQWYYPKKSDAIDKWNTRANDK